MILESLIISFIFLKLTNMNYKKIFDIKIKGGFFLSLGVVINIFLIIFTNYDFSYISLFFIKNYFYLHVSFLFFMIVGLLHNYKKIGILFMSLGILLNFIPIALNGKMPVSYNSLLLINKPLLMDILIYDKSLSHGIFENPLAYYISDIIPLPYPYPFPKVISLGDIIISLGLFITIILETRS